MKKLIIIVVLLLTALAGYWAVQNRNESDTLQESDAVGTPTPAYVASVQDIENSISFNIPNGWEKTTGSYLDSKRKPYENYITLSPIGANKTQSHPFIEITKIRDSSKVADIQKHESLNQYTLVPIQIGGKDALTYNNKDYNWNYTTNFLISDGEYVWKIFAGDVVKSTDDSYSSYPLLTTFLSSIIFK